MNLKPWVLLFICIISIQKVSAQETFPPPKVPIKIQAHKAEGKIIIDGKLDEKDWELAQSIEEFTQVEPFQGQKPHYKTRVKILYDSENLYIGAYCEDSIPLKSDIRVQSLNRDFDFLNGDFFGIRMDPFNGKRNCLGFDTNPYGVQKDLQAFDAQIVEINWNALWKVKTQIGKKAWVAEFSIPFTSIRYPRQKPGEKGTWTMTFIRIKRKINEFTSFPPLPRSASPTRMAYGAEIVGLDLPNPKANIQAQPYILYLNDRSLIHDTLSTSSKPKLGIDVKWAINTHSQLDFTVNPDFAQADIDQPIINLGRSAVNLPEKRPFFLDNAGLFFVGIPGTLFRSTFYEPFYSRTIGLNSEGLPQNIQGGARFVDRTTQRTLGGMFLRQSGADSLLGTDYFIGRYQKNFGKEENVGILITNKYEEPIRPQLAHVSNTSISINGIYHLNSNLNFNYLISGTQELKDHSKGLAGSFNINYKTNDWTLLTEHHYVSQNYNPALGFLSRQGVLYNNFSLERNLRSKSLPKSWKQFTPGIYLDLYNNLSNGQIQEEDIAIDPVSIEWANGEEFFAYVQISHQNLTDTFSPLHINIVPGQYNYTQGSFAYNSDLSRPFSFTVFGTFGNYYNGTQLEPKVSVTYTPDPHYVFSLTYDWGHFQHLGILNQNINTHLIVGKAQLYYNPRLYFNGLLEYNSLNQSLSYNAKFTWEYSPLSFIYLVLTNVNDKYNQYQERQVIGKISFIKQF